MSTEVVVDTFVCPKCGTTLEKPAETVTSCACGWRGAVYVFHPLPPEISVAEHALSDDAVCSNHPNKKAVAICAGTGDYICDLCRVDLRGETYSVQYLDGGGQEKAKEVFANSLARPDRMVFSCIALSIVTFWGGVVLIPIALFYYPRIFKMRRTNPLYRKLVGRGSVITLGFILSFFALAYIALAVTLGVAFYSISNEGRFNSRSSDGMYESEPSSEESPPEF